MRYLHFLFLLLLYSPVHLHGMESIPNFLSTDYTHQIANISFQSDHRIVARLSEKNALSNYVYEFRHRESLICTKILEFPFESSV